MIILLLIYLLIGSLIWMALDGAGAVAGASRVGRSVTASVMMIVAWPVAARRWVSMIFSQGEK